MTAVEQAVPESAPALDFGPRWSPGALVEPVTSGTADWPTPQAMADEARECEDRDRLQVLFATMCARSWSGAMVLDPQGRRTMLSGPVGLARERLGFRPPSRPLDFSPRGRERRDRDDRTARRSA